MSRTQQFVSDWQSSPASSIVDLLDLSGKTMDQLVSNVGIGVLDIVKEDAAFDHGMASALAEFLGGSAQFWLRRDQIFQEQRGLPDLPDEKEWVRSLPYAEMARFGWLPSTRSAEEKIEHSLDFFECDNLREWQQKYESTIAGVAFRTTFSFENDAAATLAWLRKGEQIAAIRDLPEFDADSLLENVDGIKALCRRANPGDFLPKLESILAESGVGFAVVRAPKGCRASGATRIVENNRAILQLSFRHLSDDHFWFTLFHEIGHLVLHRETKMFLEGNFVDSDEFESEANSFASDVLVPMEYRPLLAKVKISAKPLIALAYKLGISPGILVGQMQHAEQIHPSKMNFLKRRYKWN
ncbi:ImmA/IrrE family metallo-endopeptidase [Litorivita sp. NS0012-18]|uniref:XRE family transcriptional regulator n=1 Tax=Litorivita sp. NS0012-18 TaxID=3127655 RepID=UPI0031023661